jgi:hypothetical protein
MHKPILVSVIVVLLAAVTYATGGIVPGNYTFKTFAVPNSGTLGVEAINDNIVIVGYLSSPSGSPTLGPFSGFQRSRRGAVTPIADPADGTNTFTEALGINDKGTVVGEFFDSSANQFSGFFENQGVFTTYNLPGLSPGSTTAIEGINERGDICGFYLDSSNFTILNSFVVTEDGQITKFSLSQVTNFTEAVAINYRGVVVGTFEDASGIFHGFIRKPDGTVTVITVPNSSTTPGLGTTTLGINEDGWISGHFWDSQNVEHGYTRSPGGRFFQIDVPGATSTAGGGINNEGIVVGHYNVGAAEFGYIATPREEDDED